MDDIKRTLDEKFDSAIVGTQHQTFIPIYSMTKIIKVLIKAFQMDYFEAKEHLETTISREFDESTSGAILLDDLHFVM